jgi:hypothetical protein
VCNRFLATLFALDDRKDGIINIIRHNFFKTVNKNNINKIGRCFVFYGVINFGSLFHSAVGVSK